MIDKKRRIQPWILPLVLGLLGGILASGNKDRPAFWVGLIIGVLLGIYITARINRTI